MWRAQFVIKMFIQSEHPALPMPLEYPEVDRRLGLNSEIVLWSFYPNKY